MFDAAVADLVQQGNKLKHSLIWEPESNSEPYQNRIDKFEERILGSKKKHARIPNRFDKDAYLNFIQSDLYKKINADVIQMKEHMQKIKTILYRAIPTGDQHEWIDGDSGMIVRIRPEYLEK